MINDQEDNQELDILGNEEKVIYKKIDSSICGELLVLSKNKAEVSFVPKESMICDDKIIHSGFIFGAASYAAMCAINKKNSLIITSETKFFAPVELGQEVLFRAVALQSEGKKCEVKVEGLLLDIKIFEGIFAVAIFDKKLFKFHLKEDEKN